MNVERASSIKKARPRCLRCRETRFTVFDLITGEWRCHAEHVPKKAAPMSPQMLKDMGWTQEDVEDE